MYIIKLNTPKNISKLLTCTLSAFWKFPTNAIRMTVCIGNCKMVLNRYRLKLMRENMLLKIEGGLF